MPVWWFWANYLNLFYLPSGIWLIYRSKQFIPFILAQKNITNNYISQLKLANLVNYTQLHSIKSFQSAKSNSEQK